MTIVVLAYLIPVLLSWALSIAFFLSHKDSQLLWLSLTLGAIPLINYWMIWFAVTSIYQLIKDLKNGHQGF